MYPVIVHIDERLPLAFNPNYHEGPTHAIARRRHIAKVTEPFMWQLAIRLREQLRHRPEAEREALRTQPLTVLVTVVYPPRARRWDRDNAISACKFPVDLIARELGRKSDRTITTDVNQRLSGSVDRTLFQTHPEGWTTISVELTANARSDAA